MADACIPGQNKPLEQGESDHKSSISTICNDVPLRTSDPLKGPNICCNLILSGSELHTTPDFKHSVRVAVMVCDAAIEQCKESCIPKYAHGVQKQKHLSQQWPGGLLPSRSCKVVDASVYGMLHTTILGFRRFSQDHLRVFSHCHGVAVDRNMRSFFGSRLRHNMKCHISALGPQACCSSFQIPDR